jgi:hypothetical protein
LDGLGFLWFGDAELHSDLMGGIVEDLRSIDGGKDRWLPSEKTVLF